MKGYIYLIPTVVLIIANLILATRGAAGFRKNVHLVKRNKDGRITQKRNHKTLYEDYYPDNDVPVNYDIDYYPYKSLVYEDEDEDGSYEEQHTMEKKHKPKRRGSKEKSIMEKENLNKINQKNKIKSQKKCKTNLKIKNRREISDDDFEDFNQFDVENINEEYGNYLPEMNAFVNPEINHNIAPREMNVKNFIPERIHPLQNVNTVYRMYNYDRFNKQPNNKVSPYDYLHINNRSQNNFDDSININGNIKHEFNPNEFNSRLLTEVLGESNLVHNSHIMPQCPVQHFTRNFSKNGLNNNGRNENPLPYMKNNGKMNYLNDLTSINEDEDYYFGKNTISRNEEYEDNMIPSNVDVRTKREQKVKTISLSFPAIAGALASIPRGEFSRPPILSGVGPTQSNGVSPICTSATTVPAVCTTKAEECATQMTTRATTTTEYTMSTTVEECCTTEQKCSRSTLCLGNFKELNEGNKLFMDLSNYVSNMFHTNPTAPNNNSNNNNNNIKVGILSKTKKKKINNITNNIGGSDIGNNKKIQSNKFSIIRIQPNHLVQRSNNKDVNLVEDLKNNIYIVQLLKDLSAVGHLTQIPLHRQQDDNFSVSYVQPRRRRQLGNFVHTIRNFQNKQ